MNLAENEVPVQTSGTHESVWTTTAVQPAYESLQHDIDTDVVVVGGGIAGVTAAYCLQKSGKKVVLVEDGLIGSGETGRTTAHLVVALDDRYYELERMFGEEKTKLIAESHRSAIEFVRKTVEREHIDCDFRMVDGYLFRHPSDQPVNIGKELSAARKAGLNVEPVDRIPGLLTSDGRGLKFAHQATFHPLKYLAGLCQSIIKAGGEIFTRTHAEKIDETGIVTRTGFHVNAKFVVVATNTPVNNKFAIHLKQFPYRTYVIGAKVARNSLPDCLWWDTGDFNANADIPPYHYIRTQRLDETHDLLIIGGEDHPTGLADTEGVSEERRYTALESWAKIHFNLGEVVYRWSGQVMEPMDGMAFIGRNPWDKKNVFIITGDSGNGMTHGTLGGMMITDMINGHPNKFESIYDPSRFKGLSAGGVFVRQNVGGFRDYLRAKKKDQKEGEEISLQPGQAKVMQLNGKKYGVYCDENHSLHYVSADCTHLKCTVRWNNDEKSWDCPCHGSRFTYKGEVLNGPANSPLDYFAGGREQA